MREPIRRFAFAAKIWDRIAGAMGYPAALRRTKGKSCWASPSRRVFYNPREPLMLFFHEAAHASLRHEPPASRGHRATQEAEAWLWAEEACRLWGVRFDYRRADRYFATYISWLEYGQGWRISWKYRDE